MKNEEIVRITNLRVLKLPHMKPLVKVSLIIQKLPDGDYNYKTNPYILKDLESQIKEDTDNEKLMGVLAILRYCSSTINGKSLLGFGILLAIFQGVSSPVFSLLLQAIINIFRQFNRVKFNPKILQWSCISLSIAILPGLPVIYQNLF